MPSVPVPAHEEQEVLAVRHEVRKTVVRLLGQLHAGDVSGFASRIPYAAEWPIGWRIEDHAVSTPCAATARRRGRDNLGRSTCDVNALEPVVGKERRSPGVGLTRTDRGPFGSVERAQERSRAIAARAATAVCRGHEHQRCPSGDRPHDFVGVCRSADVDAHLGAAATGRNATQGNLHSDGEQEAAIADVHRAREDRLEDVVATSSDASRSSSRTAPASRNR